MRVVYRLIFVCAYGLSLVELLGPYLTLRRGLIRAIAIEVANPAGILRLTT